MIISCFHKFTVHILVFLNKKADLFKAVSPKGILVYLSLNFLLFSLIKKKHHITLPLLLLALLTKLDLCS